MEENLQLKEEAISNISSKLTTKDKLISFNSEKIKQLKEKLSQTRQEKSTLEANSKNESSSLLKQQEEITKQMASLKEQNQLQAVQIERLNRELSVMDNLKEKLNDTSTSFNSDDAEILNAWVQQLQSSIMKDKERWKQVGGWLNKSSGALLTLCDRLPKYKDSINKILVILQKVEQTGRANLENQENFISLAKEELTKRGKVN